MARSPLNVLSRATAAATIAAVLAVVPTVTSHAAAGSDRLYPGQTLGGGQQLASGAYKLVMQGDGNLVEYGPSGVYWSSNTARTGGSWAVMQSDGNFVIYTAGNVPVWSSGTARVTGGGGHIVLQSDGNVVVYAGPNVSAPGVAVWVSSEDKVREAALAAARSQLGVPYVWAGMTPRGPGVTGQFDCSGLTAWSYSTVGIYLPHKSTDQYGYGRSVATDQLIPGDLIFYSNTTAASGIHHVAMYSGLNNAGQPMMVEALQTGTPVHEVGLRAGYLGIRRIYGR